MTYEFDEQNSFIDQLNTYDEHEQVMLELAEMGDNSLWARGDVMLHILPPEESKEGRPTLADQNSRKTLVQLARAGRMNRSYANRIYLCSNYYERKTVNRLTVISAGVDWSFADLARRKVPGGPQTAVKELLDAKDRNLSFREFKNELTVKYPDTASPAEKASIEVDPRAISLLHGDMLEVLEEIQPRSIDLVIADPPYNVTPIKWDKIGTPEEYINSTRRWLEAIQPALKGKYHLFWFCSPRYSADIEMVFRELSLPIKSRIVWHRRNMSMGSDAQDKFIDTWEMVFHIGNKPLHWPENGGMQDWGEERFDVQTFAVPQTNFTDKKTHPTQKPLGLMKRLVEYGSEPGDAVLDPFAGSGTTGHACALAKHRTCILIEKEDEYIKAIRTRLVGVNGAKH